eukprot:900480-Pelagomonas_calceolata.AAC.2
MRHFGTGAAALPIANHQDGALMKITSCLREIHFKQWSDQEPNLILKFFYHPFMHLSFDARPACIAQQSWQANNQHDRQGLLAWHALSNALHLNSLDREGCRGGQLAYSARQERWRTGGHPLGLRSFQKGLQLRLGTIHFQIMLL